MRLLIFLSISTLIIFLTGCKGTPTETVTNNYYTGDSLSNPSVLPKIIFTDPANGAVGPFNSYLYGYSPTSPLITIQFNKLYNVQNLRSNSIRLTMDGISSNLYPSDYQTGVGYLNPYLRNILIMEVRSKYLAGKTYTITVDTTLIDIHGYKLSQPYIFSFVPEPRFRMYYGYPNSDAVYPSESISLSITLNSSVDSTFFKKIQISPSIKGNWQFGSSGYNGIDSTVIYYPTKDTLLFDTKYSISIAGDAKDANGLLISGPSQFSFTTEPLQISSYGYSTGTGPGGFSFPNNFSFRFNGLLDTSTVRSSITITPSVPITISFNSYGGGFNSINMVLQSNKMSPNTLYQITLSTGIRSKNGSYMKKPFTYSFTSGS